MFAKSFQILYFFWHSQATLAYIFWKNNFFPHVPTNYCMYVGYVEEADNST